MRHQRIGVLDDAYLSRDRSLGLSRLLWEVDPGGSEVRALRATLGLDSGYVSRQLRRLESDGLVTTDPDIEDGRVRTVRLTRAGVTERTVLDRASDELAESILDPLSDQQRDRLVAAMTEVERLLLASQVRIELTDPRDPGARHCLRSYFEELARRFENGFDPAQSISASDEEMTPPNGLLLVATLQGAPVGCGALKVHPDDGVAEVKRMWCAPAVRGLGLGRRLLERLVDELRRATWEAFAWRPTARWPKPSVSTRPRASSKSTRSTASPTRTTGSSETWRADQSTRGCGPGAPAGCAAILSHRSSSVRMDFG